MNVLALDGSSNQVQIVIHDARKTSPLTSDRKNIVFLAEEGEYVSEKMLFLLKNLLSEANFSLDDLDAVMIISGPGSFTSLRICAMIAKIVAYTKKISLYAFSHFDNERLKLRKVFTELNDISNQYFLLVHMIHQREFAYCVFDKNQLYDDQYAFSPKIQRLENLDIWLADILQQCPENSLMIFGESRCWLLDHLRKSFPKFHFVDSSSEFSLQLDGISEKKIIFPFFERNGFSKEQKIDLNFLIDIVLQGHHQENFLYCVDSFIFEPDYVGGSWKIYQPQ